MENNNDTVTQEDDEEIRDILTYEELMAGGASVGDTAKNYTFLFLWIALTVVVFIVLVF